MLFFGIKPCPDELRSCQDLYLVYGFPIPSEWLPNRYEGLKAVGMELDHYEVEYTMAMEIVQDASEEECEEM